MTRKNQALEDVKQCLTEIKTSLGETARADAQNQGFTNLTGDIHREGQALLSALAAGLDRLSGENRELREVVRLAIADIATSRQEVQQVRTEIEALRREAAEARAAAAQPPSSEPPAAPPTSGGGAADGNDNAGDGGDGDGLTYSELLDAAGGISHAELTCHRDTWAFIVKEAGTNPHFALSVDIEEDDEGTVDVGISGRSLIAITDAVWNASQTASDAGTRSLATTIYRRINAALNKDTNSSDHEDGDSIHIVIDDRTPPRGKPAADRTGDDDHPDTPGDGSASS